MLEIVLYVCITFNLDQIKQFILFYFSAVPMIGKSVTMFVDLLLFWLKLKNRLEYDVMCQLIQERTETKRKENDVFNKVMHRWETFQRLPARDFSELWIQGGSKVRVGIINFAIKILNNQNLQLLIYNHFIFYILNW